MLLPYSLTWIANPGVIVLCVVMTSISLSYAEDGAHRMR